jgi:RNA-binding protein
MPSTELRRCLRGSGHSLAPVVQIGKLGATDGVFQQISGALLDHELIKVKLGSECPQTRFELAELLAAQPGVKVAQILGRTLLLYRRHPKKPKFEKLAGADENSSKPAARIRRKP